MEDIRYNEVFFQNQKNWIEDQLRDIPFNKLKTVKKNATKIIKRMTIVIRTVDNILLNP